MAKKPGLHEQYSLQSHGVTQSLLGMWRECKQKARLYLLRWTPNRTGKALTHGILGHSVLEHFHKMQQKDSKFIPTEAQVAKVVQVHARKHAAKEGSRWSGEQQQEFEMIVAQLTAVYPAYFEFWRKKPLKWVNVEGVFRVPFVYANKNGKNCSTWLNGRLDGAYMSSKKLWLMDAKNKSRIDENELGDTLLRDFQINFYLLAVQILTGKVPEGFTYNIIRRPGLKLGKKESMPGHVQRIRKHIADEPEHYFKRFEVSVDNNDLVMFKQELCDTLTEFHTWFHGGMPVQFFGQPCVGKYGMCQYVPIDYRDDYSTFHKRKAIFSELED